MKYLLHFNLSFIVLLFLGASCQRNSYDGYVYFYTRNTQTKEGNIVLKYNDVADNISHVGIAFGQSESTPVYNISYDSLNADNSALMSDVANEFWHSKEEVDNQLFRLPISEKEYDKAIFFIDSLSSKTLFFDFSPSTGNGFYCSEFVYDVMKYMNPGRFSVVPVCKAMHGYERIIVNEDSLCYVPADFFLQYHDMEKIK